LFEKGERLYNFQGVRRFKQKWKPDWEDSFICAEPGLPVAGALLGAALLMAGGVRGLLPRRAARQASKSED
jgi:phosphatidylglycerol lysyltransferase